MAKPCYPWYCTECGSAINDRTNNVCKSKLTQTSAMLIQARLHDGKKETSVTVLPNQLEGAITTYTRFMCSVQKYPHHRRRFAYAIRIYAKPQGEE